MKFSTKAAFPILGVANAVVDKSCGLIVTGATGWLGRAVAQHATSMGCVVVAAGRRMQHDLALKQVHFELEHDEEEIASAIEPVLGAAPTWAVVHCAGLAHVRVEDQFACERLHRINVEGTSRLAKACSKVGIGRLIYVSSISVYGWGTDPLDRPLAETDPVGPDTAYGRTKLAGERVVEASIADWRIARLATLFGAGDRANFSRLARAIRHRRFLLPGSGSQKKSCIDIDTAARAIISLALLQNPPHKLVNIGLRESPTLADISASLARVCGVSIPPSIPIVALRAAALCGNGLRRIKLPAPITTHDLERLCSWSWVDASRACGMLPALEASTFASGMEKAATYYRQS